MSNKYLKDCPYDKIDVYRVLHLFNVTDPGIQHAIKKLLFPGERGNKSWRQDLKEAITAIQRSLDMDQEGEVVTSVDAKKSYKKPCPYW